MSPVVGAVMIKNPRRGFVNSVGRKVGIETLTALSMIDYLSMKYSLS